MWFCKKWTPKYLSHRQDRKQTQGARERIVPKKVLEFCNLYMRNSAESNQHTEPDSSNSGGKRNQGERVHVFVNETKLQKYKMKRRKQMSK